MGETVKINKRQRDFLDRMRRSQAVLHCESDATEEGARNNGRRFFLEPGGKSVGPRAPIDAKGLLVGRADALFADDAQSYVLAP